MRGSGALRPVAPASAGRSSAPPPLGNEAVALKLESERAIFLELDLIWKVRLDTAARLLDQKAGSVSEIAYGVGFKSVSHFSEVPRRAIKSNVISDLAGQEKSRTATGLPYGAELFDVAPSRRF